MVDGGQCEHVKPPTAGGAVGRGVSDNNDTQLVDQNS